MSTSIDTLLLYDYYAKPSSFCVSLFLEPHPPSSSFFTTIVQVATSSYLDYYYSQQDKLFVSPSVKDDMKNSQYITANLRHKILASGLQFDSPSHIKEITAIYYAMIEEVDHWIGKLIQKLKEACLYENTIVIITSDHGEMLGRCLLFLYVCLSAKFWCLI